MKMELLEEPDDVLAPGEDGFTNDEIMRQVVGTSELNESNENSFKDNQYTIIDENGCIVSTSNEVPDTGKLKTDSKIQ